MKETSEIEITFDEDGVHTVARASIAIRGVRLFAAGRASRNPADTDVPIVGEELAAARALSDLAHQLVEAAAEAISQREGRPTDS